MDTFHRPKSPPILNRVIIQLLVCIVVLGLFQCSAAAPTIIASGPWASSTVQVSTSLLGARTVEDVRDRKLYHPDEYAPSGPTARNHDTHDTYHDLNQLKRADNQSFLSASATTAAALTKRTYVPTPAQCDEALRVARFDGSKAIFFSRPADPTLWVNKLGRIPIRQAYRYFLFYTNPDGPQFNQNPADPNYDRWYTDMWAQLSAGYARAATGTVYVALNPGQQPNLDSNWLNYELPILRDKGLTILQVNAQDTSAEPVQIWPPPMIGHPPP